ncbi:MAG: hypothetical protein ACK528_12690 [Alphaproteobacteria bacterium]
MMTQEQSAGPAVGKNPSEMRRQRPAPNGQALPVGRAKGTPNRLTVALKDAVERAARDCHPQGLAGWLVDRANGSIGDRQIFAAVVSKVIPLQIQQHVQGGISINLNWLGGRQIGTVTAQTVEQSPQVVDLIEQSADKYRIVDQHTAPQTVAEAAAAVAQKASGAREGQGS